MIFEKRRCTAYPVFDERNKWDSRQQLSGKIIELIAVHKSYC
jgi:hypothetical protein